MTRESEVRVSDLRLEVPGRHIVMKGRCWQGRTTKQVLDARQCEAELALPSLGPFRGCIGIVALSWSGFWDRAHTPRQLQLRLRQRWRAGDAFLCFCTLMRAHVEVRNVQKIFGNFT